MTCGVEKRRAPDRLHSARAAAERRSRAVHALEPASARLALSEARLAVALSGFAAAAETGLRRPPLSVEDQPGPDRAHGPVHPAAR
jgi:hypothetical protein